MVTGNIIEDVTDRDDRSGNDPSRLSQPYPTRAPGEVPAPWKSNRPAVGQGPDNRWAGIIRTLEAAAQEGRA
jgi:hypothetical protein